MITIATIGFDATVAGVVVAMTVIGTVALHGFWMVVSLRYRGCGARIVRGLRTCYWLSPVLLIGFFAFSIHLKPLVHCQEPLGGDCRPIGFILAWVVVGSVIALIGLAFVALQADWRRVELPVDSGSVSSSPVE